MKNESRISVRTLTAMALLIAMSIVFSRVLSISTGFVRFNLGSLPVLLAGILFGPWAGFVVGMVADIIGGVLAGYAINPLITLGAASIGLVGGLGWQKLSHLRTGNRLWCSVLAAHFVGSMVINSLALHIFYGYAWAVLIARIPNALALPEQRPAIPLRLSSISVQRSRLLQLGLLSLLTASFLLEPTLLLNLAEDL